MSALKPAKPDAAKSTKLSSHALKKARKQRKVDKKANPKQQLVQTVALGNLTAETTAQAMELARAAGKVHNTATP